jgi:RNA polymerase sigma-70 factor (ECF subfamily)
LFAILPKSFYFTSEEIHCLFVTDTNVHSNYQDKELLSRVAAGNVESFSRLFYDWKDKLYSFALKFMDSPEEAEDLVQDIFTKLWTSRERLSSVHHLGAYLYKMVRNQAISGLRRKVLENQVRHILRRDLPESGLPVDETVIYKQVREKIHEIVNDLPQQQRMVYKLGRDEGLRQEEIAGRLNIAVSTVENHMRLALIHIRKRLLQYYPAGTPLLLMVITQLTHR